MEKITVLIADDHPIFRKGLISIINKDDEFSIAGESSNGKEALEFIKLNQPDIAILDIDMPVLTGIEVVKALKESSNHTRIVFITMHKDESLFNAAMDLGVKAYILKDSIADDLLDCIKTVYNNNYFISPKISGYLIKRNEILKQETKKLELLSKTEKEILKLLSLNITSKQIAAELCRDIRTIETHRNNICTKLGLKGHNALLLFSIENKEYL
jgi:DNA-binding NarL/FixJ family response regulator